MTIFNFISALGGVGLFLFGMSLMGQYLEQVAGAGLEKLLEKLTNTRIKGFAVGILVTSVIQSSAATTIMALGFVNAGIMKLVQAIPVVFGANIGSTVTAQIIRLNGGAGESLIFQLIKPSNIAPILVCCCALLQLVSSNKKAKDISYIVMGFGILFIGMDMMEDALSPLSDSEAFRSLFTRFTNPFLGFLVGMLVTMALQSSSASVGILQALALSTGTITFAACLPIIVGQNVGKCITVILGSLSTGKKAKRLACSHLLFNFLGAIIVMSLVYLLHAFNLIPFWDDVMTMGNIADIHTLFNVITSLCLLPFVKPIADLTGVIIRGDKDSKMDKEFALLDEIFLDQPSIALDQSQKVINAAYNTVRESYKSAISLLVDGWDDKLYKDMDDNEGFLDKTETVLSDYIVKITTHDLTEEQSKHAGEMLNSISDLERMGDYCMKIADVVTYNNEQGITFSRTGLAELQYMINAVQQALDEGYKAFTEEDKSAALKVEPLVVTVKGMSILLRDHHTARLQAGDCSTQAGISLNELINCFERLASHASNVTLQMLQKINNSDSFDLHEMAHAIRHSEAESDKALMQYYENMYMTPVVELGQAHKALFKWADTAELKTKKITEHGDKSDVKTEEISVSDKADRTEDVDVSDSSKSELADKSVKSHLNSKDVKSDKKSGNKSDGKNKSGKDKKKSDSKKGDKKSDKKSDKKN